MKIPSPAYAIGALGVLAFLGEMNKRGYYGSTFGYGSSNDGDPSGSAVRRTSGMIAKYGDPFDPERLNKRPGSMHRTQWIILKRMGALFPDKMSQYDAADLIHRMGEERRAAKGAKGSKGGSRAWKDIPDKYRKMSSAELRKLAASGDSVAAQAYEEKQMAYDAFHAGLAQDERQDERRYGRRA